MSALAAAADARARARPARHSAPRHRRLRGREAPARPPARAPDRARLEPGALSVRPADRGERSAAASSPRATSRAPTLAGLLDVTAATLSRVARATAGVSVGLRALLLVAALVATGGAVFVISVSRIAPDPVAQALLTAVVSLSFVGTGVIALRLPAVRTLRLAPRRSRLHVADQHAPRGQRCVRVHDRGHRVERRLRGAPARVRRLSRRTARLDGPAAARHRRLRRRARPAGGRRPLRSAHSLPQRPPAESRARRRDTRRSRPASRSWRPRSLPGSTWRRCSCSPAVHEPRRPWRDGSSCRC